MYNPDLISRLNRDYTFLVSAKKTVNYSVHIIWDVLEATIYKLLPATSL